MSPSARPLTAQRISRHGRPRTYWGEHHTIRPGDTLGNLLSGTFDRVVHHHHPATALSGEVAARGPAGADLPSASYADVRREPQLSPQTPRHVVSRLLLSYAVVELARAGDWFGRRWCCWRRPSSGLPAPPGGSPTAPVVAIRLGTTKRTGDGALMLPRSLVLFLVWSPRRWGCRRRCRRSGRRRPPSAIASAVSAER